MERKARVQRTTEEKWQIVVEGLKSGNIAETCRKYEIAPNLYYRWKDEVEQGAKEFDITLLGSSAMITSISIMAETASAAIHQHREGSRNEATN